MNLAERPAGRRSRGRVAALGCLYAEFDAKDFAGGKAAALAHVEALSPAPSALVDSGGGYHAYWLLAERWELADDAERERARGLQTRWVERVGGDRGAKDLARVLRVPGTLNTKYSPPRPVELLYLEEGRRYTVAELEALAPAPAAAPRPARAAVRPLEGPGSPIARFNAEHSVEELLDRYGAARTREGWACNCGVQHDHQTQLVITAQGLAVFYSARCRWAPARTDRNGRPVADAFDLFAQVEHGGDKKAAAAALRPARAPRPAEDRPEADAAAHRAQEAARKRQARHAAAQATLQAVRDRAAEDSARTACDRALLRALLDVAGDRDWCRPSKARLVAMTGYSLGAVKRALMRLEAAGYIASSGEGGGPNCTAVRTFLRGSSSPPMIHESRDHESLESDSVAGEGGAGGLDDVAGDDQVDADVERVLAHRAEAQERAALAGTVAELAAALGEEAPELPAELGALQALAEQLLARLDAGPVVADGPVTVAGASFDPEAAPAPRRRRVRDTAGLEWHLQQLRELDRYRAEQQGQAEPAQVEASPAEQLVKGPPRGDRARRAYFALLGKAKNAASSAQRRYLRGQAAALEELYTPAELQAARERAAAVPGRAGPAPAPPSPAPGPCQLDLLAYLGDPPAATAPIAWPAVGD